MVERALGCREHPLPHRQPRDNVVGQMRSGFDRAPGGAGVKTLLKMPAGIVKRMRVALDAVAADPAANRGDWKPPQGSDFWPLRVGDGWAVRAVRDGELALLVVNIAPRRDAYQ